MPVKRVQEFAPGDRYFYDFKICTASKGWAQFDTEQDASYFGNWINPFKRILFSYCEGDCTTVTCDTDEEFAAEVKAWIEFYTERDGKKPGIDPGFNNILRYRLMIRNGLKDWMH